MINLTLVLIGQRILLWLIAVVAVTHELSSVFQLSSHRQAWSAALNRVAQSPEASQLAARVGATFSWQCLRDPFIEIAYWVLRCTPFTAPGCLIALSNIFFVLFIFELFRLVSRSAMPEAAAATAILAILWPASFELGLGERLAFEAWALALALRCLLDNKWLNVGLGYAGFLLYDHRGVWFLPLIVYFFLFFQQHFQKSVVARRLIFFVVPVTAALWITNFSIAEIWYQWRGSFLSQLFPPTQALQLAAAEGWPHFIGQALSLVLLVGGAALTLRSPLQWLYRSIPVALGLYALAFIQWGTLGSRGVLAAAALQGIAENFDRKQLTLLEVLLLFFGAVEVFRVFH